MLQSSRIITVLACSGRVIRILEHCRVRQSIELESVPTVLHIPRGYNDRIICGMADGRVVVFKVGNLASTFTEEIIIDENDSAGAVTTIDVFDLTGDSKLDLIVGRRDGTVQVFSLPNDDNTFDSSVRQIYCEVCIYVSIFSRYHRIDRYHYRYRTSMRVFHRCKVAVSIRVVIAKLSFRLIRVGCLD